MSISRCLIQTLWRDHLTSCFGASADPKEQARAFPGQRLRHLHHDL